MCIDQGITDLTVTLDSKLIVEQMNGNWKVKNANIKPLFERTKNLTEKIKSVSIVHTLREGNKVADKLVNDELDRH